MYSQETLDTQVEGRQELKLFLSMFTLFIDNDLLDIYRISSNLSDTSNYPDTLLGNFRCSNTTDTPVL